MAAETANTRKDYSFGNARVVQADLTAVSDADTWASGLTLVLWAGFTPTTSVACGVSSFSGGTVTLKVASGPLAGTILAVGY